MCNACFNDLPLNNFCCYRCAENLSNASNSAQLCGRCLTNTPHFDETYAPYLYQHSMAYLITQLKFGHQYKHARLLGSLLAKHVSASAELPECIIPMPLHHNRYQERGFNQSIEIARHLARLLDISLDLHSCVRQRDTVQQTSLPAAQRLKNMRKAFSMAKPLKFQHVAIVDDVMTTGATASALALTLKETGISRVDVWVCARA